MRHRGRGRAQVMCRVPQVLAVTLCCVSRLHRGKVSVLYGLAMLLSNTVGVLQLCFDIASCIKVFFSAHDYLKQQVTLFVRSWFHDSPIRRPSSKGRNKPDASANRSRTDISKQNTIRTCRGVCRTCLLP